MGLTVPHPANESLHEIALRHGADKAAARRSLAAIYDDLLTQRRYDPVSLLEIGVLEGASLRMWRDYFPRGKIYGFDRDGEAKRHEDRQIKIFIGDQEDEAGLDALIEQTGDLDVVVDDGGHRARQQIGTLVHLWPHVRPSGMYIVEDIHTSYLADYGMAWRGPGTTIEFLKGIVDDVHAMWHEKFVTLKNVAGIYFFPETCVLRKTPASNTETVTGRSA
jgi:hypothetical protein